MLPGAQEIARPELCNVRFAVAAGQQFGGDVANFADVLPALQAATIVEVRGDADVVDTHLFHGVVDGVDILFQGCFGFVFENGVQRACILAEACLGPDGDHRVARHQGIGQALQWLQVEARTQGIELVHHRLGQRL
ncbi:hypothetical protein D3C79_880710 [compost metagenome]